MSSLPYTSVGPAVLSIIRGLRNGVIYGSKVRFPHALVMTVLFREGSLYEKMRGILKATFTHARNLSCFVAVFKGVMMLMSHLRNTEDGLNTVVAGFIGGGIIFGGNNPINSQINMYIMSRVVIGLARTAVRRGYIKEFKGSFRLYAAVCWALVMYLFYHESSPEHVLQKSMVTSMDYLYLQSNEWPDTRNIIDWFLH